ncbi:MAG: serine/threonine protein kinase [Acidimicrobiia bacterium]
MLRSEMSGTPYVAEELLGEGGQGQVWRVRSGPGMPEEHFALKWYFPHAATDEQHRALTRLVDGGAPDGRFLWPLELVLSDSAPGFGYLMGLRAPEFYGMVELMHRRIDPTFRTLATAGFQLADGFLQLHSRGLCYLDISFGNVFVQPEDGRILICDNDNVRIDGSPAAIAGTPKFMAPELIRDLISGRIPRPDRRTDLFSLAVLLFYMFVMHHPFEGKREAEIALLDAEAQNELYGTNPVFIFSPDDPSNRPQAQYHQNALDFWPIYPQYLRDLFTQSFTAGVDDPENGRVQESQWRRAMADLRDGLVYCHGCGLENFLDPAAPSGNNATKCWNCGAEIISAAHLAFGGKGRSSRIVALTGNTRLYPHHLGSLYDFSHPIASVNRHPTDPAIWGLKNLSTRPWAITTAEGGTWDVEQGRSVTIAPHTKIDFGPVAARVRGDRVVAGET